MKRYILNIYFNKSDKKHSIVDCIDCMFEHQLESVIGKKYYSDSDKTKLHGTCKKYEIVDSWKL